MGSISLILYVFPIAAIIVMMVIRWRRFPENRKETALIGGFALSFYLLLSYFWRYLPPPPYRSMSTVSLILEVFPIVAIIVVMVIRWRRFPQYWRQTARIGSFTLSFYLLASYFWRYLPPLTHL